ncbi:MAG: hypothetical protein O7C68_01145, partial [Rickettsia endosymbiont of Ixodes ricinus]|nr:hypothetical protein [Rickettsia endosymbiont of Ixodes ricinus]MCZ6896277.1 hypothetical protein [Rickettsia endosymbiont of Ixodes ricinus]
MRSRKRDKVYVHITALYHSEATFNPSAFRNWRLGSSCTPQTTNIWLAPLLLALGLKVIIKEDIYKELQVKSHNESQQRSDIFLFTGIDNQDDLLKLFPAYS